MWDGFAGAVVRIRLTTGAVVLTPRAEGVDAFPFDAPVHIVTAHNPAGVETDEATNERRHRELGRRLASHLVVPTVGSAPDGSMAEPGYAVLDVSLEGALEIGREFGQRAIYRWTADSLSIVGTDEPHLRHLGWSLSVI
jgi:hypothetical protein